MHLKLRRDLKEGHMEVKRARWGLDYRTVNRFCDLLRVVMVDFTGVLT